MDPLLWLIAAAVAAVVVFIVGKYRKAPQEDPQQGQQARRQQNANEEEQRAVPRRVRGGRDRMHAGVAALRRLEREGEDAEEVVTSDDFPFTKKIGAKRLRKMEEKERRKEAREQEEAAREDKKRREQLRYEEGKRKEEEDERKQEEQEQLEQQRREEQERQEQEEYEQMKSLFSVEEEGLAESETNQESNNLLQEFIDFIKSQKVVLLEDLASRFQLRTQDAVNRLETLQKEGRLTGVIDDRGKFIYISMEELENVARFIKQRGRISISQLAQQGTSLIDLRPADE